MVCLLTLNTGFQILRYRLKSTLQVLLKDLEIARLIFLRQELAESLGNFQTAQDVTTLIYLCSINPAYRMLIYSLRATSKHVRYTH